jgi:hypothetical protein
VRIKNKYSIKAIIKIREDEEKIFVKDLKKVD